MQIQDTYENGPPLPLPSLRLFIPPLRLVSAAMWQVVQRGDVHDYGILEEFVATVTEIVPELLSREQKSQLFLGLRARLVLELCRSGEIADLQNIQLHLDRIRSLISPWESESREVEVQMPESNFVELVESLLKDPTVKKHFFQDVFPGEFGPEYDNALQMLMLEFLSRLERLLPVPDLQQTASLLNAVPSALEECVQSVPDPQQLKTLLQYHRKLGYFDFMETLPSSFGDCIFSSLSLPPPMRVVIAQEEVESEEPSASMQDCMTMDVEGEYITLPESDNAEMDQGSALDETKELVESWPKEKDILLTADEGKRDVNTEAEPAMDMEPVCEGDQSVMDFLQPSCFQPLKRSKRLQMKRVGSRGRKLPKMDLSRRSHQHALSLKVSSAPKKSRKKFSDTKTCPVCGKTFPRATAMRRHQETHTRDYKFMCSKCGKCFRDRSDLKRHQLRVCEKGEQTNYLPLSDRDENEKSPSPSTSKTQDTSDSKTTSTPGASEKGPLDSKNCSVCGRFFARSSDMVRHMRAHSEERPHQCVSCKKRFKYSYVLKKHQRDACKKRNQKHMPQVNQTFLQQDRDLPPDAHSESSEPCVTAEMEIQVSNPQLCSKEMLDSKTCPVCGRSLTCASEMARHLRSHSKERPYHCVTCEKSFKYKSALKAHQEIYGHEGIQEDPCQSVDQYLTEVMPENCTGHLATKENDTEPIIVPADTGLTVQGPPDPKTCTVCGKTLKCGKASEMARHMLSHSEERPFQCSNCKKCFKYRNSLKKHQKYVCPTLSPEDTSQRVDQNQSGDHPLELSEPPDNEEDDTEPSISDTQHLSSPSKLYRCSKCEKSFKSLFNLKKHQKTICKGEETDTATKLYTCDECAKEFRSSSFLKTHQRMHNPFYCTDCGRILPNSAALARHKLMHKRIQCTMCEKSFTLLGRLREHYLHQHKFEGPYPCSHCEKTFIQLSYLAMHERIHSGDFAYQCSQCLENFRTSESLARHKRKHTGEKPYLCWQCGKSYRGASELSVHMGTHSDEKPFSCSQCDMSYRTKIQLNTHIEQVHLGVRYPCIHCGRQYMTPVSLKRHELSHTGERPFPCTVCGKTFVTAYELKRHERYHTDVRPFKCNDCGKAFIQSSYLTSHMRLHTGEKPYKCEVCDKSFRFSTKMKKHMRTHTGEKPFICGECGLGFNQRKSLKDHQFTHTVG